MMTAHPHQRGVTMRRHHLGFAAAAAAVAVTTGLFVAWTALGWPAMQWVDDLGEMVAALVAAGACGAAAIRNLGRWRLAWGLMGGKLMVVTSEGNYTGAITKEKDTFHILGHMNYRSISKDIDLSGKYCA